MRAVCSCVNKLHTLRSVRDSANERSRTPFTLIVYAFRVLIVFFGCFGWLASMKIVIMRIAALHLKRLTLSRGDESRDPSTCMRAYISAVHERIEARLCCVLVGGGTPSRTPCRVHARAVRTRTVSA